jgi:hypothetical protein
MSPPPVELRAAVERRRRAVARFWIGRARAELRRRRPRSEPSRTGEAAMDLDVLDQRAMARLRVLLYEALAAQESHVRDQLWAALGEPGALTVADDVVDGDVWLTFAIAGHPLVRCPAERLGVVR